MSYIMNSFTVCHVCFCFGKILFSPSLGSLSQPLSFSQWVCMSHTYGCFDLCWVYCVYECVCVCVFVCVCVRAHAHAYAHVYEDIGCSS